MMIDKESIICLSCCRGKSGDFLREMKELKRVYRPRIIILIKPKISGAGA